MSTLKLPDPDKPSEKTNYHFLKGRSMTLPQGSDPNATEKLYLEDFNLGESEDVIDADSSTASEIEYYITVKRAHDPDRGVPYDPQVLTSQQLYPWEMLSDVKSEVPQSEIGSEYSGSNYYDVLRMPGEEDGNECVEQQKDKSTGTDTAILDDKTHGKTGVTTQKPVKHVHYDVPLPPIPPDLPAQNHYNHPPLSKPGINQAKSATLPSKPITPDSEASSTFTSDSSSDSTSSSGKYNTYSSVYSVTNMANKATKEALERYLIHDETALRSQRPRIANYDFTGTSTYFVYRKMHALANTIPEGQGIEEDADDEDDVFTQTREKGKASIVTERIKEHFKEQNLRRKAERIAESDEMKEKLIDTGVGESDNEGEESGDSGGMINPSFKNVNVDGKMLGSRHSIHRLERTESRNQELEDLMIHIAGLQDTDGGYEGNKQLINFLKQRLITSESENTTVPQDSNELPVTLIL